MLTSKQRAELRAQANGLETTLMVGKGGAAENVILEAEKLLDARELVKGRVLETAMMTAREASDAICERFLSPSSARACPAEISSRFSISHTSLGKSSSRSEFATALRLLPMRDATCSCVRSY